MKKLKAFVVKRMQAFCAILALILGVGGALAFTPKQLDPCAGATLYAFNPNTGIWVVVPFNGPCDDVSGACKYYNAGTKTAPNYKPCDTGIYGVGPYSF